MAVSSEQLARADQQGAGAGEDWASATADAIEKAVQSVRAKTADPLERLVRLLVYGLLAGIVGVAIAVLLTIAAVRGLVEVIDLVWQREVWLAYLIVGGIFVLAGLLVWRRRTAKHEKG